MTQNKMLRDHLLRCFGVDIDLARCFFSTQNYAFLFPDQPYMIRVSVCPRKTRKEILSELIWLDDLKAYAATVCEPAPSLRGKLLEEFEIDGALYRAAMFRTARGTIKAVSDMNPMFFLCAGELLGKIHKVSTDEQHLGMRFQRPELSALFERRLSSNASVIPQPIVNNIRYIEQKVNALPQTVGSYGLCHGDFHQNNFFVEHNNIWLFDFDSCCYARYLYDIASFIQSCLLFGYRAGEDCAATVFEHILPWFRIGYEMNHRLPESEWAHMETFLAYRTAYAYLALVGVDTCGVTNELDRIKGFFSFVLSQQNLMDGFTAAMSGKKGDAHP